MASKKTTNKTEQASEAVLPEGLVQGIVVQASPESIKEIDNKIANAIGAIDKVEGGTVIEAKLEDPRYFYKGVVPGGFHNTYGEEVTNITTGQMAPILESLKTQFKEEDGFRYFFKYVDNIIFTIMVPLKFSKESESYLELYRTHMVSTVVRQGDLSGQIMKLAKRVAKNLNYQFNR